MEEVASAVGMTTKSGYNIQELWNEGGMAALEPKFGGGRTSKLTDDQKEDLKDMLSVNPMTTKDVRLWIKEEYGIDYSEKQVHVILSKMGLHHAKPYPKDHRRPDDAEATLKKARLCAGCLERHGSDNRIPGRILSSDDCEHCTLLVAG